MVLPSGNLHSAFAGGLATCPFPPWPQLALANALMPNRMRLQPTRKFFLTCPPQIPNSYSLDASAERFDTRLPCSLEARGSSIELSPHRSLANVRQQSDVGGQSSKPYRRN